MLCRSGHYGITKLSSCLKLSSKLVLIVNFFIKFGEAFWGWFWTYSVVLIIFDIVMFVLFITCNNLWSEIFNFQKNNDMKHLKMYFCYYKNVFFDWVLIAICQNVLLITNFLKFLDIFQFVVYCGEWTVELILWTFFDLQ